MTAVFHPDRARGNAGRFLDLAGEPWGKLGEGKTERAGIGRSILVQADIAEDPIAASLPRPTRSSPGTGSAAVRACGGGGRSEYRRAQTRAWCDSNRGRRGFWAGPDVPGGKRTGNDGISPLNAFRHEVELLFRIRRIGRVGRRHGQAAANLHQIVACLVGDERAVGTDPQTMEGIVSMPRVCTESVASILPCRSCC